jgi:hypothetical protein
MQESVVRSVVVLVLFAAGLGGARAQEWLLNASASRFY